MATPPTSTRPARGAELELTVDTLAHGGNGVARLEGYVVFVAGGLPGDRVRAVVGKSKRAYAEARAVEILEPSPDRIAPSASPIATAPDAHEFAVDRIGPRTSSAIPRLAGAAPPNTASARFGATALIPRSR